ncbi:CsiV family protein [Spongorhabdus nitratireducens]
MESNRCNRSGLLSGLMLGLALATSSSVSAATQPSAPAAEAVNWYQVDVLVFRNPVNDSPEAWPALTAEEIHQGAIRLTRVQQQLPEPSIQELDPLIFRNPEGADDNGLPLAITPRRNADTAATLFKPYISLPAEERQLNQVADRLASNGSYPLLGRYSWRVALKDQGESLPVLLEGGQNWGTKRELRGTIQVSNKRYLHVDADFWLRQFEPVAMPFSQPDKMAENQFPPQTLADINEEMSLPPGQQKDAMPDDGFQMVRHFRVSGSQRVVRTSEITYFDSPVFGILVKLTPWKPPLAEIPVDEKASDIFEPNGL